LIDATTDTELEFLAGVHHRAEIEFRWQARNINGRCAVTLPLHNIHSGVRALVEIGRNCGIIAHNDPAKILPIHWTDVAHLRVKAREAFAAKRIAGVSTRPSRKIHTNVRVKT